MKSMFIIASVGVLMLALGFVATIFGTINTAMRYENNIIASYNDNKNTLAQNGLKVREAAKVNDKYAEQVTNLMTKTLDARYGEEGSKALFQFIQEQNPTLDVAVYKQLQIIIAGGRDEFKLNQKLLLDKCRGYNDFRLTIVTNWILSMFSSYPKIDLADMCRPVTSAASDRAFETKQDVPLEF